MAFHSVTMRIDTFSPWLLHRSSVLATLTKAMATPGSSHSVRLIVAGLVYGSYNAEDGGKALASKVSIAKCTTPLIKNL